MIFDSPIPSYCIIIITSPIISTLCNNSYLIKQHLNKAYKSYFFFLKVHTLKFVHQFNISLIHHNYFTLKYSNSFDNFSRNNDDLILILIKIKFLFSFWLLLPYNPFFYSTQTMTYNWLNNYYNSNIIKHLLQKIYLFLGHNSK
jgi:hypothetical protein